MAEFRDTGICQTASVGSLNADAMFLRATPVGELDELVPEDAFLDWIIDATGVATLEDTVNGLRIATTAAGDGLGGGGAAALKVDIAGTTAATTLDAADELLVSTAGGLRRIDFNLLSAATSQGSVCLYRGNTLVGSYGSPDNTAAQNGTALVTAMAAALADDVLVTGPGLYDVNALVIAVKLTWLGFGTVLGPSSGAYAWLVSVGTVGSPSVHGVHIEGVTCDGRSLANTSFGNGFLIYGDDCELINCTAINLLGSTPSQGRGVYTFGDNTLIDGLHAENNGYVGIRASNANRLQVNNTRIINCGTAAADARSIIYDGSSGPDAEFVSFSNVYCYADQALTRSFINFNQTFQVGRVSWNNVKIINKDNISAGVSFNTASREQDAKFQNIDFLDVTDCHFIHGSNSGSGNSHAFSFDSTFPKHSRFTGCTFSSSLWNMGSSRVETLVFDNCDWGFEHMVEDVAWIGIGGGKITIKRSRINLRDGVRAFTISSATPDPEDFIELLDNEFLADKATDVYLFQLGTYDLIDTPRKVICNSNTLTNDGVGDFLLSNDSDTYLLLSTDRNGDMLYDASDGNMPAPGAGPYFTGVPGIAGQRIRNIEWAGTGIRYWHSNGTLWYNVGS